MFDQKKVRIEDVFQGKERSTPGQGRCCKHAQYAQLVDWLSIREENLLRSPGVTALQISLVLNLCALG
uniref:Uncharacterized protein n=1 Tax=Arundo donax TaxID=35708 RepID=A0A0A9EG49_ARUDO